MFKSPTSTVCSEIMLPANLVEIKITPMAKNAGKIRPVAESSVNRPRARNHSVAAITTTPPIVAPTSRIGSRGLLAHSAEIAMPGSTACESASDNMACRRNTSTTPGSAVVSDTTAASNATDTAKLIDAHLHQGAWRRVGVRRSWRPARFRSAPAR